MGNDLHQPGKQAGGAADNDQRVGENKDPHGLGEGHPCRPLTNSAAPGVDQAVSTGTFRQALSASTDAHGEAKSRHPAGDLPGVAPAAAAACQMMAAELAYPTNTATKPANRVGSGRLNERIDDSHVRYNIHSMYHCAL